MKIIKGQRDGLINLFFYKNKRIALLKIEKSLQQFFYKKNIYVMSKFNEGSIEIFFYKKKSIAEINDYIQERKKENNPKLEKNDLTFLKPLYDRNYADVRRSISLTKETLWNGRSITQKTDAVLYEVNNIQSDQYYSRVKPNYDKEIDLLLSSNEFKEMISCLIDEYLNIPFVNENLTLKERKEIIYEKDEEWHTINLYKNYLKIRHEIIIYLEFLNLYHNNDGFVFFEEFINESSDDLNFSFIFKDKNDNKFEINYTYKKVITEENISFSGSSEMVFNDFTFKLIKREVNVDKNINTKKKEADLIRDFSEKMKINII